MPNTARSVDLCSTCIHQPGCMYCGKGAPPVQSCNEFDCESGACRGRSSAARRTPAVGKTARPRRSNGEETRYHGVCVTCAQRGKCALSHTPGGVWHCEEYA